MKKLKLTLSKKILLLLLSSIGFTILFSFFFLHFLYSELYLSSMKESVIYQGQRTASHYHYGELSDEIIEKIQWYNIVSEYEIIVVDDLEQLSSYFPYKINMETLIAANDRADLENGQYIMKEGFVEELDREILGAIFPIKGEQGLIGFIYIYVPLAAIQDVFKESIPILIVVGTLFFLIIFLVANRLWKALFKPLKDLQQHSFEVSRGNYSNRLKADHNDEIGQVTEAFNKMSKSLEQQEERKKEFTSNLVHELRTPLTYISGYTQALKQLNDMSSDDATNYITTIEKETERLNKLINDLIELNHLEENLYVIDHQPIAIAQLLFDTIDLFTIHLDKKELNPKLTIEEDLIITGDPQRLEQVFYNVIDNAIKYSSAGSKMSIELKRTSAYVEFKVVNEGLSIHQDDIDRIGERFFRTDKARNRTTGGTGLGLSIVKEIVKLHDGTFSLTSDRLTGTKVTIRLPGLLSD
ncbi:sensor histidine kinase [Sporosarcina sp. G11-34]|uniref:sensor histidine kinase n=1 Tax=Sporosarcina sp. G11-34 TaxID=2849605 RepID=UPI0022A9CDBE|nr:HAMP domain-containing sensor histidine kinase [Sporosarcina sp. G11-34]MCZ2257855.1 HAMP domain-containing histidine kinase [Sporosarcina sp. G11-34]